MRSFRFASGVLWSLLLLSACGEKPEEATSGGQAQTPPVATAEKRTDTAAQQAASTEKAAKAPAPAAPAKPSEPAGEKMAPTPATVTRATELKDKPFIDAKTLKRLPAKTGVTIVDRSGGWLKVVSDGQPGWVRLLHVSSRPAGTRDASELESVAKIATGRSGSGNIVSTTGIRGLSEEQLRAAQPSPEELKRLEDYGVTKEQAADYARKHRLERRQVAHLPEPG